jgi:hypothetical protein
MGGSGGLGSGSEVKAGGRDQASQAGKHFRRDLASPLLARYPALCSWITLCTATDHLLRTWEAVASSLDAFSSILDGSSSLDSMDLICRLRVRIVEHRAYPVDSIVFSDRSMPNETVENVDGINPDRASTPTVSHARVESMMQNDMQCSRYPSSSTHPSSPITLKRPPTTTSTDSPPSINSPCPPPQHT